MEEKEKREEEKESYVIKEYDKTYVVIMGFKLFLKDYKNGKKMK